MAISRHIPTLRLLALFLLSSTQLFRTVRADNDDNDADQPVLKDNSPNCTCYTLNSTTGSDDDDLKPYYFTYHRFWDFRALATSADQYATVPDAVTDDEDDGAESFEEGYLDGDAWGADWGIQGWGKEATDEFPVRMVNSPRNVFISQTNASDTGNADIEHPTYLSLRTVRLDAFQSAAEVENLQKNMLHASLRMRARVVGAAGAVAGFFTFFDDDNESDVEILTADPPAVVRYTNQPSVGADGNEIPAASRVVKALPEWREWREHRIDWVPGRSSWWLDGVVRAESAYSVPRKPSGLTLNMWSDGGEWSGEMEVGGVAELQVQWVEVVFNTSGPVDGPGSGGGGEKVRRGEALGKRKEKRCDVVCRVDGVGKVGFPEVAHVSGAAGGLVPGVAGWGLLVVVGVVTLVVGAC